MEGNEKLNDRRLKDIEADTEKAGYTTVNMNNPGTSIDLSEGSKDCNCLL